MARSSIIGVRNTTAGNLKPPALVQPEKLLSIQSDYLSGHIPNFDNRVRASCDDGDDLYRAALEKAEDALADGPSKNSRKRIRIAILALSRATIAANEQTARLVECVKTYGTPPPAPLIKKTVRQVAREVGERHGLAFEDLIDKRRDKALVLARHEIYYTASFYELASSCEIGRVMNRDHSTILHGIRKHKRRIEDHKARLKDST